MPGRGGRIGSHGEGAPPPRSPAAAGRLRRALSTPGGLFVAASLLIVALPVTKPIADPDFWWHLRTGQEILDHHGLLSTDPYTYTVPSHHWTMHEWLTEVSFAVLHRIGGLGLIVIVLSLLTWVGLLALAHRARWHRPNRFALGGGLLLAVVAGYPIWGPRAQMITFALCCLLLAVVERHLRRGGRGIWLLVPLMLLWANLHSGFIIGLAFYAAVLIAETAARLLGRRDAIPAARLWTMGRVLAACLAVVAINPYGPRIYLYPFETQGSAAQQALILEWHSPDFHDPLVWGFGFLLLSLALMVTVTRRVTPRDAVLAVMTTALALQSVRHIALFIAATTPLWIQQADLTGARLAAWWRTTTASTPRRRTAVPPRPAFARLSAVVVAVLALIVLLQAAGAATTREDSLHYATDYPVCASRWLSTAPGGLRIFNQYGEGGYLAYRLSGRGDRVFIFGDAALMGDDLLQTYGRVEEVRPDWQRILERYRTDIVVFDSGTPFAELVSASTRWSEVYHDSHSVAFVPTGSALATTLPRQPDYAPASRDTCALLGGGTLTTALAPAGGGR